ncbi:hypothetical protein SPRG_11478 [Saprolegnia parasitica CBS 223.65]|uniref:Uncharacterized protein n=1 Tax=Saprolegnia parasitica (strain CBS 223.65) TaxID=695850 RepID=A0A067CA17_SAPPC|nr:hypothetical protein SPRG_11478 [Saprolegnia parasitica CBS 223.65]KDO23386.1 hypothetical protein SPRG_11478 [Saprolegnia parasitica CBS 223.65]|eukprot:XP_012205876.1 hypothetical protein SPRG_11478 [Saprolegnia parasitica CBS 223.65]
MDNSTYVGGRFHAPAPDLSTGVVIGSRPSNVLDSQRDMAVLGGSDHGAKPGLFTWESAAHDVAAPAPPPYRFQNKFDTYPISEKSYVSSDVPPSPLSAQSDATAPPREMNVWAAAAANTNSSRRYHASNTSSGPSSFVSGSPNPSFVSSFSGSEMHSSTDLASSRYLRTKSRDSNDSFVL